MTVVTDARAPDCSPAPRHGADKNDSEISKFGHGGPRENSGGARPGAGRPRKPAVELLPIPEVTWIGALWCVYQTHPQAERLAARELTRAGYRSYCPLIVAERRDPVIRSMSHRVLVPRFPGYGFIELGAGSPWAPVLATAGIARLLLSSSGRPAALRAGEIELHMADDEALCDLTPETLPPFEPGTRILIEEGAFTGRYATVTGCDGVMTSIELILFGALRPTCVARRMVVVAPTED